MSHNPTDNLKLAERGAIISITAYVVLSIAKLIVGYFLHSSSLVADGFNNVSDIIGNIAILIGLRLARRPADLDHRFGHWKIEDLSSLLTSFIMFVVGFQVLLQTIQMIVNNSKTEIDPIGAIVGIVSAAIMYLIYLYNKQLANKAKSGALLAAAKDNLSDAVTSIGTSIAIIASSLNFPIIDKIVAIIITFFILKTAYDIFIASAFSLSDGFDDSHLKEYELAILQIPKISRVKSQRGRTYGSNVYLDLVLEMNPDLSVYESHEITEEVEKLLREKFNIYDIDIHVEPSSIPEDEIFENIYNKLYKYEKIILSQIPDYTELLSKDIIWIANDGQSYQLTQLDTIFTAQTNDFSEFSMVSVSQKTKLITYTLNGEKHTSLWRRHENWQLLFHQITTLSLSNQE